MVIESIVAGDELLTDAESVFFETRPGPCSRFIQLRYIMMCLSRSMKALFFAALLLLTPFSLSRPHTKTTPDVFWLDKYGNIAWEDEKARLDNFAIQLMHDPNEIGYFYVRSGRVSCRGEAQARAVRAKNYMTKVRNADGNRIIWRDIGYGDGFEVSIWLAPRGKPPLYVPDYQRPTGQPVIKDCGSNPLRELDRARRRRA